MMRKTDFAFWVFLLFALMAAGTTVLNLTRTHSAVAGNAEIYRQLDLFGDVLERVRADYVEKPDVEKLIEAAINGMLSSLDPHSSYLSPKALKDMEVQTSGEFGGLGIEVTMDREKEVVKVVAPIDDTPAARAGIQAGDLITHLDGKSIRGLTLSQAVEKMRGPVNSSIVLTILRKGRPPFDVKIIRELIRIKSVRYRAEGDVGYIRITSFNKQTSPGLKKAITALKKEIGPKLKGYILDLRRNPGGLLDQAIAVSDAFLDKGTIVLTRGRNKAETERSFAKPGDLTGGKKVVVLIDGGSASASEIVAGALQDRCRAVIVGTRSFGKGSVQSIITLENKGAIRLTTARYYTPSGRSIQAQGIMPDIVVEQDLPEELKQQSRYPRGEASLRGHLRSENGKEEAGSTSYIPADKSKDNQLNYALALLRGEPTKGGKVMKKSEGADSCGGFVAAVLAKQSKPQSEATKSN